ncbi:MAG TPA: hypothetical protein VGC89_19000 [Pyrinomonadaceae bacterium]
MNDLKHGINHLKVGIVNPTCEIIHFKREIVNPKSRMIDPAREDNEIKRAQNVRWLAWGESGAGGNLMNRRVAMRAGAAGSVPALEYLNY